MPKGFTKTATGSRAWVRVTSKADEFDELRTKRFPKDVTPQEVRAWRERTRAILRQQLDQRRKQRVELYGTPCSFRADAVAYLAAVKALPTYKTRCRDIRLWVDEFGSRRRETIAPHEIRAVRDRWLTVGPRRR